MSHGGGENKCEPNLVPLLDLVLQLVMFFMVCANFVMEQVSRTIQLPLAVAAKPIDPGATNIIFLNVNAQGHVELSGLDVKGTRKDDNILQNQVQVQNYMKGRFDEDKRRSGGDKDKIRKSLLIIRADKHTPFEKVYSVMKGCRAAGYENCQLRAIVASN
jgi:biopolymer transport protein ExbD